jgi:hypothetical protein
MPLPDWTGQQAYECELRIAEAGVIKSRETNGKAKVTCTIDARVGAQIAAVCEEWNGWSADAYVRNDLGGTTRWWT